MSGYSGIKSEIHPASMESIRGLFYSSVALFIVVLDRIPTDVIKQGIAYWGREF